jgi:ketosteroid isomerase-like protein
MDDRSAVSKANKDFYKAFEEMDMKQMEQVWSQSSSAICIHPGWEKLTGWSEIRESWRAIFAHTGYMRFEPSDVDIQILENTALVSCVENIFTVADGMTIHSRVACTNLFVRTDAEWKLMVHHGSAIAESQSIQFSDAEMSN